MLPNHIALRALRSRYIPVHSYLTKAGQRDVIILDMKSCKLPYSQVHTTSYLIAAQPVGDARFSSGGDFLRGFRCP